MNFFFSRKYGCRFSCSRIYSAASVVHLCHTTHTYKIVGELILVADFGWLLFSSFSATQKEIVCQHITQHGPLVLPSKDQRVFVTSRALVSMIILVQALEAANVVTLYIFGYGMKMALSM